MGGGGAVGWDVVVVGLDIFGGGRVVLCGILGGRWELEECDAGVGLFVGKIFEKLPRWSGMYLRRLPERKLD